MCGDVEDGMSDVIVRATYEFDGWAVVAVVPTADGRAAHAPQ